jgi:hypothetical protein
VAARLGERFHFGVTPFAVPGIVTGPPPGGPAAVRRGILRLVSNTGARNICGAAYFQSAGISTFPQSQKAGSGQNGECVTRSLSQ